MAAPADPECGFVFAATGEKHANLARRAAHTLRQVMPDAAIDLFTDQAIADPVFDRIHAVEHSGRRPKMEALRRARFARTIYLDCDIIVVQPIGEIFELLDRFDLVGAHALNRDKVMMQSYGIPRSFSPINGGLLGIRRTDRVQALMAEWEAMMVATGSRVDQPILRELLYHSDLRIMVLAPEYNLIFIRLLFSWPAPMGAPSVLHCRRLHAAEPGDPSTPFTLEEGVGPVLAAYVRALLDYDNRPGNPLMLSTLYEAALRGETEASLVRKKGRRLLQKGKP